MASRKRLISRSVACSLAALLLLSGCMFMVSTFQSDSEEWVLVEDEVLLEAGVYSSSANVGGEADSAEYTFTFDEDTSTYIYEITGGSKSSSNKYSIQGFACSEDFDYSKVYKFVVSDNLAYNDFSYVTGTTPENKFNLRSVASDDDGVYTAEIVIYDQYVTDLSYKDMFAITTISGSASSTFDANTMTVQVYELTTDNTGSIAAGITGLIMIVCGVFAMPMHNILRRR